MSSNPLPRRDFLKTVAAAGVASLLRPAAGAAGDAPGADRPKIRTRPFGKTGVAVSCLGLGGMFDILNNQLLLRQALEWGVSYWDTADCYEGGRGEPGFGKFFAANPALREKVFLVTKSDDRDPAGLTRLLHRSLERLETDYIDLYFVHGAGRIDELNDDTRAWAEQAKKDGKIKFFGFSTHKNMPECLEGAARLGWVDGIMFTYNYRLMHKPEMKAAVEACVKAGIGLTAMKTQGGGSIRVESGTENEMASRFIQRGFTEAQAKLKAVWENPDIACICSQMPNMSILASNVAAALDQVKLTSIDRDLLEQHASATGCGYCAGCEAVCSSALLCRAPVGDIMRALMYHRSYGDTELARRTYRAIAPEVLRELETADFSAAEAACPQKLAIGRLVREAGDLLA